jgi:hypothetical protein
MRNMTWWQFSEAVDGFVASKSDKEDGLSQEEEDGLAAMLDAPI